VIVREPLQRTIRLSSAASLIGLLFHYTAFYLFSTPLLTDQLAEWMMARMPSRYAVPILTGLGAWAKPCAATGALAFLGFVLFALRLLRNRLGFPYVIAAGAGLACAISWNFGYASFAGALAFWIPALSVIAAKQQAVSESRRTFLLKAAPVLMSSGVVAVAAESFLREVSLEKRATQPIDLFPFQPPLDRQSFGGGLVRKEVTPIREFYGMSKNAVDPLIDLASWRLKVTIEGKLLRAFSYGELLGMQRQYRFVTLRCISNTLKSDLMGTAQWGGIYLSQLINRASLPPDIVEAALIGVEGHDDSLKIDYAFSEDSLLALGMNGKTLSRTHGFPVRLLAPSYYGCRNVKWIGEIRFVRQRYYGTWQRLGYTKEPLIHICSHIDRMKRDGGLLEFGGVSFAGTRGIKAVRVRANSGPWQAARMEPSLSQFTWTRWVAQLPAEEGAIIEANAQDCSGAWQELHEGNPFPNGLAGPTIVIARA
jgi:DMSO/TMAO reductase YedYZ molybdopterin-dependent catalytic subunit